MNDIKIKGGHPISENLSTITVGDKTTCLEISDKNGARVNGDLEVTGDIKGNIKDIELDITTINSSNDITLDADGDIVLETGDASLTISEDASGHIKFETGATEDLIFKPTGNDVSFLSGSTETINFDCGGSATTHIQLNSLLDTGDYCKIATTTHGATTITTEDDNATAADLLLDIDGDITLDSATGVFEMKGAGTTAKFADMYAGMILGCTHVFGSGTGGVFKTIGATWANLLWDTDKFALVTFVIPPSNRVKISVHLPYIVAASYAIQLGLATDSSATTLGTKYENDVDDANRADSFNINYSWIVEGSDHSWSAGDTETLYIMAYAASNIRFYTGGTNTSGFGGVIVEATALPATISDGSEP